VGLLLCLYLLCNDGVTYQPSFSSFMSGFWLAVFGGFGADLEGFWLWFAGPFCFIDSLELLPMKGAPSWQVMQDVCRLYKVFLCWEGVDPTWGWICFGLPNPSSLFGGYRYGFHLVRFGDDWFSAWFGLICFFIYCYSVHPCHVKLIEFRLSSTLAMAIMPSALITIFPIMGRWGLTLWIFWVVSI